MAPGDASGKEQEQTVYDSAQLFQREKSYPANLMKHTIGHDSFVRYRISINYEAFMAHILRRCNLFEPDKATDLLAESHTWVRDSEGCQNIPARVRICELIYAGGIPPASGSRILPDRNDF